MGRFVKEQLLTKHQEMISKILSPYEFLFLWFYRLFFNYFKTRRNLYSAAAIGSISFLFYFNCLTLTLFFFNIWPDHPWDIFLFLIIIAFNNWYFEFGDRQEIIFQRWRDRRIKFLSIRTFMVIAYVVLTVVLFLLSIKHSTIE